MVKGFTVNLSPEVREAARQYRKDKRSKIVEQPIDEIEAVIEKAIADLYVGFFRLRKAGLYQREYDTVGTIIDMLTRDRQHLRNVYGVKP